MLLNPTTFTYEHLSNLKFKELQKLSVQFHVNKRWAKKQELIENLLALKDNNAYSKEKSHDEEKQWRDGSLVFKDLMSVDQNEGVVDKRLTFNVDKRNSKDFADPRLTFEITQNGKQLLSQDEVKDSRQTYEVPQKNLDVEPLKDSRATFDIPPKESLLTDDIDPRATFEIPQTGKKLLKESENKEMTNKGNSTKSKLDVKEEMKQMGLIDDSKQKQKSEKKLTFDMVVKNKEEKGGEKFHPQVKMLTIPYTRISTRRTRKDGDTLKIENSPIKISKKSINIKKSSRLSMSKIEVLKSPGPVTKSIMKQSIPQSSIKSQTNKPLPSKIPTKVPIPQEKSQQVIKTSKPEENDKENVKRILRRRKSKTADEVLVKKQKQNVKISFMTPPSLMKTHKAYMPLKKTPIRGDVMTKGTPARLNSTVSHTPKSNTSVAKKPLTAIKMPDFSKIHKKQFEQMDSLQDYLRKKEERRRKLFGTPQTGPQLKADNKPSTGLFQFQSSTCEKPKELLNNRTPLKRRETNVKAVQKDAVKNRLPPSRIQTDIKDKNRSHIHGVRTNKRFELQMKFRNM